MSLKLSSLLASFLLTLSTVQAAPPAPYPPLPTEGQLQWHDMEMYAFVHFTTNTFTNKEWGYGDESPEIFNPTAYDPEQIVGTLAKTGFKGVVLTCKHHDGFCLWPTKTTKHSVVSTKWQNGKGDVVRDFAKACKKFGVKFGIYVSPWDRNHPDYGTEKYVAAYREQISELLTGYGPVFIVWHDGANGGDGYYGGKRESRSIDRSTYYDWPKTWEMVRKLQPLAVIFSDVGPDVRWVGNEHGTAGYPCWATYTPRSKTANGAPPAPGMTIGTDGQQGTENGKFWIPAEADVSIRPGWFWHEDQNSRVRTPENLLNLYFNSVGRGANLNLNVPPDRRGRIHENDVTSLQEFHKLLNRLYSVNYAKGAKVTANKERSGYKANHILTPGRKNYWAAPDGQNTAELTITLPESRTFSVIRLAEAIQLGQRIRQFSVKIMQNGDWTPWITGSSIGPRAILRGKNVTTDKLLITIEKSDAPPTLSEFSLWLEPVTLQTPKISRKKDGLISVETIPAAETRYTLDGSEPGKNSPIYTTPLSLPMGGLLKVRHFIGKEASPVLTEELPVSTSRWKVVQAESSAAAPERAFDGNPGTLWHTHHGEKGEIPPPQNLDIDMGEPVNVSAVLYTPRKDGSQNGIITKYELYISDTPDSWGKPVAEGEFSNIAANPITQRITLKSPIKGRYMRFTAKEVLKASHVSVAELGVISSQK